MLQRVPADKELGYGVYKVRHDLKRIFTVGLSHRCCKELLLSFAELHRLTVVHSGCSLLSLSKGNTGRVRRAGAGLDE